jgi:hypothetical protein
VQVRVQVPVLVWRALQLAWTFEGQAATPRPATQSHTVQKWISTTNNTNGNITVVCDSKLTWFRHHMQVTRYEKIDPLYRIISVHGFSTFCL